jgi:hypothetical protein
MVSISRRGSDKSGAYDSGHENYDMVILSIHGVIFIDWLLPGEKFNSGSFCEKYSNCLPRSAQRACCRFHKSDSAFDNATPIGQLSLKNVSRVANSDTFPNLRMTPISLPATFLFGDRKAKLKDKEFTRDSPKTRTRLTICAWTYINRARKLVPFWIFPLFLPGHKSRGRAWNSETKISIWKVLNLDYLEWHRGQKSLVCSERHEYNTTFFVKSVVPDLVQHVWQESRRKILWGIMVHLDNERRHSSVNSETALTATKAYRIPALVLSPDWSLSDFFLFGMLKEWMSGTSNSSPDKLISTISEPMASFPKGQLVCVYKNWMKRLN